MITFRPSNYKASGEPTPARKDQAFYLYSWFYLSSKELKVIMWGFILAAKRFSCSKAISQVYYKAATLYAARLKLYCEPLLQ